MLKDVLSSGALTHFATIGLVIFAAASVLGAMSTSSTGAAMRRGARPGARISKGTRTCSS